MPWPTLHENGLIHRDIKPANIIFAAGLHKLADIGLVTSISDDVSFVGTMGFCPPEGPGTPLADIYGLGKVLYEAATGLGRERFPDLPPEFDEVVDRLESGQSPEDIEKAIPDLGSDTGGDVE